MQIKIYNPYFDKTYNVIEDKRTIELQLDAISRGHEDFLRLHDVDTDYLICIAPRNCAIVEVEDAKDSD